MLDVHGQEGGVVEDVQPAQPVVELQAVERSGPVVEAEDVVGDQIGVAVDDVPVGDPRGEQRRPSGQEFVRAILDFW